MEQRIVTSELPDGTPVRLTIIQARTLEGMKRARLVARAERANQDDPDVDRAILRMFVYPPLAAATIAADGIPWPLSFEQFLELPDSLMRPWEDAVFELNPHWMPKDQDDEQLAAEAERDEKNGSRSASA